MAADSIRDLEVCFIYSHILLFYRNWYLKCLFIYAVCFGEYNV